MILYIAYRIQVHLSRLAWLYILCWPCINMLQSQVKNQHPAMRICTQVIAKTHIKRGYIQVHAQVHSVYIHKQTSCKLLPSISKTSRWTEASASAAINHVEAGAEGKAHLVHIAPTPGWINHNILPLVLPDTPPSTTLEKALHALISPPLPPFLHHVSHHISTSFPLQPPPHTHTGPQVFGQWHSFYHFATIHKTTD